MCLNPLIVLNFGRYTVMGTGTRVEKGGKLMRVRFATTRKFFGALTASTVIAMALVGSGGTAHADLNGVLSQCRASWSYYRTQPADVAGLTALNGGLQVGANKLSGADVNALLALGGNTSNLVTLLDHEVIATELSQIGGGTTPALVQAAVDASNLLIAQHGGPNGSATLFANVNYRGLSIPAFVLLLGLAIYNSGSAANCRVVNEYSLFGTTAPAIADSGDPGANVELGMKFNSDKAGWVTGVRYFKSAANTGVHTGTLWTAGGTPLATVTFANETASGWQQASFSTPVAITAGTTYVVSYHTTTGHYAFTQNGFTAPIDNAPIHGLGSVASGGNGVFHYGDTSFPNETFEDANYWVDVAFVG